MTNNTYSEYEIRNALGTVLADSSLTVREVGQLVNKVIHTLTQNSVEPIQEWEK